MRRGRAVMYGLCLAVVLISTSYGAYAQKMPERRLIREGNREYEEGKYEQSELEYRRALEKSPDSYQAEYNLTNSLYKQERFEEAAQKYTSLAQREGIDAEESARGHYNAGNSLFQERKFKEALEEYKESLRKNPNDVEAKYNLAYTKKMLEEQEDDQNKDDQEKDDDQENEQEKDSGDDKQDDKDDGGEDNKDDQQDDQKSDEKEQQGPPNKPNTMSKEEAEQLLDAMQMNEDKTRDKMEEKEATAVGKSGKNW